MAFRIVADSSANLSADGAELASVPLMITAGSRSFVDDETLDVRDMMAFLASHKGRSTTACPGVTARWGVSNSTRAIPSASG